MKACAQQRIATQGRVSPGKPIAPGSEKEKGTTTVPVAYCPHCDKRFKIRPAWEGRKTQCPKCETYFSVEVAWRKVKTKKRTTSRPGQMCCVYCEYQFRALETPITIDNELVCETCQERLECGDTILAERDPFKKKLRRMDAITPYVRRYLVSGKFEFCVTTLWIQLGALPLCGLGILFIYGAVQCYRSGDSSAWLMGFGGFKLISLGCGLMSRRQAMLANLSLITEFPLLHKEVEQALTYMLEDYESLPENMITFQMGRDTWEGGLSNDYAVFVSSDRVLFLGRDEVKVQVSDSGVSESDEEVDLNLQLGKEEMEVEMPTDCIERLTVWLKSE